MTARSQLATFWRLHTDVILTKPMVSWRKIYIVLEFICRQCTFRNGHIMCISRISCEQHSRVLVQTRDFLGDSCLKLPTVLSQNTAKHSKTMLFYIILNTRLRQYFHGICQKWHLSQHFKQKTQILHTHRGQLAHNNLIYRNESHILKMQFTSISRAIFKTQNPQQVDLHRYPSPFWTLATAELMICIDILLYFELLQASK